MVILAARAERPSLPDILLTGMPRSGTTLVVSLLANQSDTIALAEPIQLVQDGDRAGAVIEIQRFMRETRRAARAGQPVMTKHVGGKLVDNWVESPKSDGSSRRVMEERSPLVFEKELSDDFILVVKHPAEFTALADLLVDLFPIFAIVRNPLAVLASWHTVDMPVSQGRMPMAEAFSPELHLRLTNTPNRLDRQVALIEWQLRTYLRLPRNRVIRYEDVVANASSALRGIVPITAPYLSVYDPKERYAGIDFRLLADALLPITHLITRFYPNFRDELGCRRGP